MNALESQLAFRSALGKDWHRVSKQGRRLRLYGELMLLMNDLRNAGYLKIALVGMEAEPGR